MRALLTRHAWLGWLAFSGCAVDPLLPDARPVDADGDGVTVEGGDCDDDDPLVAAGRQDQAGNLVDEDCDGLDGVDQDGDGVASSASGGVDCDDADAAVLGPGAPDVANDGVDADCDGADGVDVDGDGSPSVASGGADCDDANPDLRPGNPERCDGVDQNCANGADDERGLATLDDGSTFRDLDAAVRRAVQGDTIRVCPGTYAASLEVDQDLTITGLGAREDVVLDARGAGSVLTVGPARLRASHLTIRGGLGAEDARGLRVGGGLRVVADGADVRLDDVVVTGNEADEGAGVYTASDAAIVLTDSLITGNRADVGGGVRLVGGTLDAVGSTFVDNVGRADAADVSAEAFVGDSFTRIPQVTFQDVEVGRHDPAYTDAQDAVVVTGGTFTAVGGRFSGVVGSPLVIMPPTTGTPSSQVHLHDTVFEDNSGGRVGGLLDGGASVVEVMDVVFRRNSGRVGALMILGDPSIARNATRATLSGLTFEDNVGEELAGGLVVFDVDVDLSDSTFTRNVSLARDGESAGGAITVKRSDGSPNRASLEVEGCTFTGNHTTQDGGAIAAYGAFAVSIWLSTFESNTADHDGGAIFMNGLGSAATLDVNTVSFLHQRAEGSGGAVATRGVNQQLSWIEFADCHAGRDGGGVDVAPYLDSDRVAEGALRLMSSHATDCSAGGAGGLLHSSMPSVTVTEVEGARLSASRGGAFAFDPYLRYGTSVGPIADVTQIRTSETSAVRGGWMDAVGVDLLMANVEVTDSSADVGGGLYLQAAVDDFGQAKLYASAEIVGSTFTRCTATGNLDQTRGGAIAGVGTTLSVLGVTFRENQAARGRGGAIWLGPMRHADGSIAARSVVDLDESTFDRNGATEGGALAIDAASGRVADSVFTGNAASARGGSVAVFDGSERPGFLPLNLERLSVSAGSAPLGGAIYATSVDLMLDGCFLEGNSATWGGALAIDAAFFTRLTMVGGAVRGNVASVKGGGIYAVAPGDASLGMLDLRGVLFGETPGSNLPEDFTIEGVGSTPWLGGRAGMLCLSLDATCR